jgi:SAM-dependent methyltransferase
VNTRQAEGVLLTGVYGSGKSSVAEEIAYLLEQRGELYALLDLDYLSWAGTGTDDRAAEFGLMLQNLAAVAACGPGLYLRELLERGAEVTAFDASQVMVDLARQQTAGWVRIDQAALGKLLPYPDGAFDLIVCALAIHYASDRAAAFAEFCRVLRAGGAAVVSTQHPVMDWLRKGGSYFQTILETDIWHTPSGDQPVQFWREPLSALCTAATDAGFLIEKVIEPVPVETMRGRYPRTSRN